MTAVPTDRSPTVLHGGVVAGPAATAIYLLVPATRSGPDTGWTLEAWHGSLRAPSTSLADRGAAADAAPRVAQTAALRLLAERGVAVWSWLPCGDANGPMFLTWVCDTDPPPPV